MESDISENTAHSDKNGQKCSFGKITQIEPFPPWRIRDVFAIMIFCRVIVFVTSRALLLN